VPFDVVGNGALFADDDAEFIEEPDLEGDPALPRAEVLL
jgi:hypothetical protein